MILIQLNGQISKNGKNIAKITWKEGDSDSKILVLAANAVRIEEKRRKGK